MSEEIEAIPWKEITKVDQLHQLTAAHQVKVEHIANLLAHYLYNVPLASVFHQMKEWFMANTKFDTEAVPAPSGNVQLSKYIAAYYLLAKNWKPPKFDGKEDIIMGKV